MALRRFAEATLCTGVSTAPNAVYGHDGLARCVVKSCLHNRNVDSVAGGDRHKKFPEKNAHGTSLGPCGEWIRRVMSKCSAKQGSNSTGSPWP